MTCFFFKLKNLQNMARFLNSLVITGQFGKFTLNNGINNVKIYK